MYERRQHGWKKWALVCCAAAAAAFLYFAPAGLRAAPGDDPSVTDVTVHVTEAGTGKPIFQARLTLRFRDPDSHFGKVISYSAKTNMHGQYKFSFIPMEMVVLDVTAPKHQTFGKKFQITKEHQVLEVKLKKPQPLR
ncbi:MAG TPA: hypothetical protein VFZ08_02295 [Terriglobia bacterium]|nr:hypothetical protein [Terriglobia bacterium]